MRLKTELQTKIAQTEHYQSQYSKLEITKQQQMDSLQAYINKLKQANSQMQTETEQHIQ